MKTHRETDAMLPAMNKKLDPIGRTDTLARQVKTRLKEAIMAGHFKPGGKLAIRGVAAALNVSLTPAREALFSLAAEGSLQLGANGSVYVPMLTEERVQEVTKIRVALEGLAAREAVRHITDAEVNDIVAINAQLTQADEARDYAQLIALNWQFHFSIYRASGMDQLLRMIEGCWLLCGPQLNVIYPKFGELSDSHNNHLYVVKALRERDGERLASAISMDINLAADALIASIREAADAEAA
jgi:DNA-binding GntR family transcriptional regulator